MKQKVNKTFYANRKIYELGKLYNVEGLDPTVVKEYFEPAPQKTVRKKTVRKPKSEPKKVEDKTPEPVASKPIKTEEKPDEVKSEKED